MKTSTLEPRSSLSASIGSILLWMNILLTLLGSVLIFRYRLVVLELIAELQLKVSTLTRLSLSWPYAMLLPALAVIGIAGHFWLRHPHQRLVLHIGHFAIIFFVALLFLGTTVPQINVFLDALESSRPHG